jgi:two-component system chemotaxis response regulator CheY
MMRILIVDDDYICRTQYKALLQRYGDCDSAPNGKIALELIEVAYDEEVPYQLITVDIDMPEMNGHALIQRIREFEKIKAEGKKGTPEVKILMISAKRDASDVMSSFREGCEGYLCKPINAERIEDVLKIIRIL